MIVSHPETKTSSTKREDALKRRHLYELQDAASSILGEEHPVASCLRQTVGGGGAAVVASGGGIHYNGLVTCQNGWLCPVCSRRLIAERRKEISRVLHRAHERGQDALFITVTVKHHAGSKLADLLNTILAAWRSVFSGDRSGERQCLEAVAGQIKALEIRFGRSAWHPHLHLLVLVDHAGMDDTEAALLDEQIANTIFSRYQRAVERRGMVTERAAYNCQTVKDLAGAAGKYIQKFEAGLELTAGQDKDGHLSYSPWQLLEMYAKDPNAKVYGRSVADLFKEYAAATKKRRQISYSRDLHELAKIKEDGDGEISEETPEILVIIEPKLWWRICRHHLRATVLEVAESGGRDGLIDYLDGLREAYGTK